MSGVGHQRRELARRSPVHSKICVTIQVWSEDQHASKECGRKTDARKRCYRTINARPYSGVGQSTRFSNEPTRNSPTQKTEKIPGPQCGRKKVCKYVLKNVQIDQKYAKM